MFGQVVQDRNEVGKSDVKNVLDGMGIQDTEGEWDGSIKIVEWWDGVLR